LVSAHEGYKLNADGDTVESQQAAFDIGSNIADSDLWVTKDGYIVEMHDNDVSHSTDGTGLVTQMTLAQVLALHTRYHDDPIPQLNDSLAIQTAHEAGRYLMFETKFSFAKPAYLQLLDSEINAAGMVNNVIIYSNYMNQLQALKQMDPALTVYYKALDSVPDLSQVQDLNGVMLPAPLVTKASVAEFHGAGLSVMRERIAETQSNWARFVKTGADSLMTDDAPTIIAECQALG
jgi:glycerophosphoryl diester phosphodiesterase